MAAGAFASAAAAGLASSLAVVSLAGASLAEVSFAGASFAVVSFAGDSLAEVSFAGASLAGVSLAGLAALDWVPALLPFSYLASLLAWLALAAAVKASFLSARGSAVRRVPSAPGSPVNFCQSPVILSRTRTGSVG